MRLNGAICRIIFRLNRNAAKQLEAGAISTYEVTFCDDMTPQIVIYDSRDFPKCSNISWNERLVKDHHSIQTW